MKPQEEMMQLFEEELKITKEKKEKQKLLDLMGKYKGPDEVVPMSKVVEREKRRQGQLRKYATGFEGLDEYTEGMRDTELIVIAGPTKNGKTTLAMSMTANMIKNKVVPHWFSYEMTEVEFARKMGEKNLDFIFTPMQLKTNDIDWIEAKIMESIKKYDSQIIFIDHLHYVCDLTGRNENLSTRIGNSMRRLKTMAKKWGVAIVVLAHTTKIPANTEPSTSSLRDSSFVAAEANTVYYVRRKGEESNYEDTCEVFVIANRWNGENGSTELEYNKKTHKLEQIYDKTHQLEQSYDVE